MLSRINVGVSIAVLQRCAAWHAQVATMQCTKHHDAPALAAYSRRIAPRAQLHAPISTCMYVHMP